jgi:hypothetical protein
MRAHLGEYEDYEAELKQISHNKRFHCRPGRLAAVNKFSG